MNLNDYQTEAHDYAAYGDDYVYPFLGLAGEAGEVCDTLKKLLRVSTDGNFTGLKGLLVGEKRVLLTELGDVMWYVAEITGLLGSDLETIANMNLCKLSGRKARGTITSVDRDKAEDKTYE